MSVKVRSRGKQSGTGNGDGRLVRELGKSRSRKAETQCKGGLTDAQLPGRVAFSCEFSSYFSWLLLDFSIRSCPSGSPFTPPPWSLCAGGWATWDSTDLESDSPPVNPASALYELIHVGHITKPLCASVSSSVQWRS